MDKENRHGSGGFFNGFILGLLVGAGLVFLFGTNKGKKVLQMLLEQVEESTELSDLLEIPEGEEEEYFDAIEESPEETSFRESEEREMELSEEPEEDDDIRHEFQNGHHHEHHEHHEHREEVHHKPVAKVKRFFRGSSKKLVS